jgi:lipopolysaccharide transport system ATP-binding protein
MNDVVVRVENVSKRYRLGVIGTGTLAHDLNLWWARVRGRPDPTLPIGQQAPSDGHSPVHGKRASSGDSMAGTAQSRASDYVWALEGISFDVRQGEVLGIIGRNGAGKSTILKILSRVTAPTSGEVRLRGHTASLLEIGTGFHPELTGRENIKLNGAILGMRRAEIVRRFDEIVAFSGSEVEQYIDTPVKRYSSGMYLRLAFAVAAHLDPEILMVDEVLAVGDAVFQKKCLGKMGDVASEGRTVLFVSHNMAAVRSLCSRCLWLEGGRLRCDGDTQQVVNEYLADETVSPGEIVFPPDAPEHASDIVRLRRVALLRDGTPATAFGISDPLDVVIDYDTLAEETIVYPTIQVRDPLGGVIFSATDLPSAVQVPDPIAHEPRGPGRFRTTVQIPGELLNAGTYVMDIGAANEHIEWQRVGAAAIFSFEIRADGVYGAERRDGWPGPVRPRLHWRTERLDP